MLSAQTTHKRKAAAPACVCAAEPTNATARSVKARSHTMAHLTHHDSPTPSDEATSHPYTSHKHRNEPVLRKAHGRAEVGQRKRGVRNRDTIGTGKQNINLDAQLGAAPVPPLGVVADRVASAQADPLRDGAVLASHLGKLALGAEGLVGRHGSVGTQHTRPVSAAAAKRCLTATTVTMCTRCHFHKRC